MIEKDRKEKPEPVLTPSPHMQDALNASAQKGDALRDSAMSIMDLLEEPLYQLEQELALLRLRTARASLREDDARMKTDVDMLDARYQRGQDLVRALRRTATELARVMQRANGEQLRVVERAVRRGYTAPDVTGDA